MILVGTPCYGGTVTVQYMVSMHNMTNTLANQGVQVDIMTPSHESLITRGRNFIANMFLRQPQYTHLLFIDSDIGFAPDTASRYLAADKDIVCGIYPLKYLNITKLRKVSPRANAMQAEATALEYTVRFKPGSEADEQGFREADYGSTGFMLIKRRVLEKIAEAYPELRYNYSYASTYDHLFDNYAFFDTLIDPDTREYLPEDYAFCKRWTSIGGHVHADTRSVFKHVGNHVFSGDYREYLTRNPGKAPEGPGPGGPAGPGAA